ncbi:hypothetical protein OSB04_031500 [Centaurea solstitialis]|uniref:HAT C-terminal dimerisation domain-containing protein n=1 Tax=Centaurea solstitialis TaxID=347529 RepID=A0AA38ST54_9ASTR|nr:hypothetical protein OSB04_031500 [Centaurea solstitialis]
MDLGATGLKNLYSGNVIASCLPLKNIKTIKVYVRCERRIFKRGSSDAENHRQSTLPSIGERRIFKCQHLQLDRAIGDPNKLIYASINLFSHSFAVKKTHLFDPYRSNNIDILVGSINFSIKKRFLFEDRFADLSKTFTSLNGPNIFKSAPYTQKKTTRSTLFILIDFDQSTPNVPTSTNERFDQLNSIGDLGKKMVETKKNHIIFPKVYLLLKLALILPVATSSVERAFLAMKLIKTRKLFLSDYLVSYIEEVILKSISSDTIMQIFQGIRHRRILMTYWAKSRGSEAKPIIEPIIIFTDIVGFRDVAEGKWPSKFFESNNVTR